MKLFRVLSLRVVRGCIKTILEGRVHRTKQNYGAVYYDGWLGREKRVEGEGACIGLGKKGGAGGSWGTNTIRNERPTLGINSEDERSNNTIEDWCTLSTFRKGRVLSNNLWAALIRGGTRGKVGSQQGNKEMIRY